MPLHAAGVYKGRDQECCSDFVVSSYIPTLSILHRMQKRAMSVSCKDLNILLVAEKSAPGWPDLKFVGEEVAELERVIDSTSARLVHPIPSSRESILENVKDAHILHLACHGVQDQQNAVESAFYVHGGGRLSISNIMELKLEKAFLAFLSACETAKGDHGQPDQTMHLAAAMLFAGFRSVIATMW
jgi:CHAT domain-containing protein